MTPTKHMKDINDLLRPRIKVEADFYQGIPGIENNRIKKGDVFMNHMPQQNIVWRRVIDDHWDSVTIHTPDQYPNLFRPLAWYEDRKPQEMPQYVKVNTERTSLFMNQILTVKLWGKFISEDFYCLIEEDRTKSFPDLFKYPANHFLPASHAEYLSYINSKP